MAVDIARLHYKATSGVNRGWRRSRLGGRSGAHFYAWWAPAGAVPLRTHSSFDVASALCCGDCGYRPRWNTNGPA
jgi:hypothetical protein